jgi:SAM-dependent methyltransferase
MNDVSENRVKETSYTSKSLLHCIAQAIQIPAALNPAYATDRLQIIDTEKALFLTRPLRRSKPEACQPLLDEKKWNRRPFPYSSAINPKVSEIVTALVFDLVEQQFGTRPEDISFVDPTCGSGTLLAHALANGANAVQGWDTNPTCVEGAIQNIKFMFGKDGDNRCTIALHDATWKLPDTSRLFDCSVANLPWNQNSVLYNNENVRILESLPQSLHFGAPCGFISKSIELQRDMNRLGYQILGTAHIPPQNLALPSGKRGGKRGRGSREDKDFPDKRKEICVVTVALAPK